ncbi:unnamed protein product, partial [Closterium sp. NIES-54]
GKGGEAAGGGQQEGEQGLGEQQEGEQGLGEHQEGDSRRGTAGGGAAGGGQQEGEQQEGDSRRGSRGVLCCGHGPLPHQTHPPQGPAAAPALPRHFPAKGM